MHEVSIVEALAADFPQALVLVSVYTPEGRANAMVAGWTMIASGSPFCYAVALAKSRYTLECLKARKAFVAAFPTAGQEKSLEFCGSESGRKVDKEKESGFRFLRASCVDAPLIEGAAANLECKLLHCYDSGDHEIAVGEILAAHAEDLGLRLFNFGPAGYALAAPLRGRDGPHS
jgi:flavin reductase (DIM6/NTAB) family NADH-FMN oxidoreductase RutF